jgi:hypothetical protein
VSQELTVTTPLGNDGRPRRRPDQPVNSITQRSAICLRTFEDFVEDFLENERPELRVDWPADFALMPRFNCDARFYRTVQQYAERRIFIRTKEGYVGSAPSQTQEGDFIGILLGCKLPLGDLKTSIPLSGHVIFMACWMGKLSTGWRTLTFLSKHLGFYRLFLRPVASNPATTRVCIILRTSRLNAQKQGQGKVYNFFVTPLRNRER